MVEVNLQMTSYENGLKARALDLRFRHQTRNNRMALLNVSTKQLTNVGYPCLKKLEWLTLSGLKHTSTQMMRAIAVQPKRSRELLPMRYSTKRNLMYPHFAYLAHIAMFAFQRKNTRNLTLTLSTAYFVASQINTRPIIFGYHLVIDSRHLEMSLSTRNYLNMG